LTSSDKFSRHGALPALGVRKWWLVAAEADRLAIRHRGSKTDRLRRYYGVAGGCGDRRRRAPFTIDSSQDLKARSKFAPMIAPLASGFGASHDKGRPWFH
jgi:hypothetical protein